MKSQIYWKIIKCEYFSSKKIHINSLISYDVFNSLQNDIYYNIPYYHMFMENNHYQDSFNIFSIFSRNSEATASKLLEIFCTTCIAMTIMGVCEICNYSYGVTYRAKLLEIVFSNFIEYLKLISSALSYFKEKRYANVYYYYVLSVHGNFKKLLCGFSATLLAKTLSFQLEQSILLLEVLCMIL